MFLKPTQPNNNNDDINEPQIPKNGNEVNINLLISLQSLDIDPKYNFPVRGIHGSGRKGETGGK